MSTSRLTRFWLNAGHAEVLPDVCWTTWRVAFSFDYDDDPSESAEDTARTKANRAVYNGTLPQEYASDDWDPSWQKIYKVTGTLKEHAEDLISFLGGQLEFRPTGDDDVFNYWPSGIRLAWEWAEKIHRAGGPDIRARVIRTAQTVCVQLQGVLTYDELGLPERVPQL